VDWHATPITVVGVWDKPPLSGIDVPNGFTVFPMLHPLLSNPGEGILAGDALSGLRRLAVCHWIKTFS
jgi:hypothetical protein